jgi:hypothetical protein
MTSKQFNKLPFEHRLQIAYNQCTTVTKFITGTRPARYVTVGAFQRFFVEKVLNLENQEIEKVHAFESVAYLSKYSRFRGSLKGWLRRSLDVSLIPTPEEELFSRPFSYTSSSNDLDMLLLSFECMDAEGLVPLLNENHRYDGMDRHSFIIYCDRLFRDLFEKGDRDMLKEATVCEGCKRDDTVYLFKGKVSGFRHAITVDFDGESVTGVSRCSHQSDRLDWMM